MELRQIGLEQTEEIKTVIRETFSQPPWNDDWQDAAQFHAYILDLIGNRNSLSLGLYDGDDLIGVSLGRIKHWYAGTEYWIDDLAILPRAQGGGLGAKFLEQIERFILSREIVGIVLFTEKDIPAYGLYVKRQFEEKPQRVFFEKHLK